MNINDPLNIEISNPLTITNNDIVFFGCSFTNDRTSFVDSEKMYPTLLANHFNKNLINVARNGVGNYGSFDIFGQLNFVDDGTIVILQLTELSRIRWYDSKIKDRMLSAQPDRNLLAVYHDQFLIYDLIRQLRVIVNYCRVRKIKLIIWSIARFWNSELDANIETYLSKFPEYVFLDSRLQSPNSYRVDNGKDGTEELGTGHPGPKSHQLIAEKLIAHYKKLYGNN